MTVDLPCRGGCGSINLPFDLEVISKGSVLSPVLVFLRTLRGLQTALKNKALAYKEKDKSNPTHMVRYKLRGFPHAFQVWAYETIPSLSIHVAKRLNDTTIPRIRRWSSSHSPSFGILEKKIFACMMVVKQVLKMTENEKRAIDAIKGLMSSPPLPSHNIAHQEVEHIDVEPREEPVVDDEPSSFYGKDEMPKKKKRRIKPKHELRSKLLKNYFKCTKETRIKVLEDDMKGLKEDMKCLKEDMELILSTLHNMKKHLHKVEFCDICGDAGYADVLVSCCRCNIACEHMPITSANPSASF